MNSEHGKQNIVEILIHAGKSIDRKAMSRFE